MGPVLDWMLEMMAVGKVDGGGGFRERGSCGILARRRMLLLTMMMMLLLLEAA